jgi:hypothetical protein
VMINTKFYFVKNVFSQSMLADYNNRLQIMRKAA